MKKKLISFLITATMFAIPIEGHGVIVQAADLVLDVAEFSTDITEEEEAEVPVEEDSEEEAFVEDEVGSVVEPEQKTEVADEEDGENGDLSDGEDQGVSVYGMELVVKKDVDISEYDVFNSFTHFYDLKISYDDMGIDEKIYVDAFEDSWSDDGYEGQDSYGNFWRVTDEADESASNTDEAITHKISFFWKATEDGEWQNVGEQYIKCKGFGAFSEIKADNKRYPFREKNGRNYNCYRFTAPESGEYTLKTEQYMSNMGIYNSDGAFVDGTQQRDGVVSVNLEKNQVYLLRMKWTYPSLSNNDCFIVIHKTREPESVKVKRYPDQKAIFDENEVPLDGLILTEYYTDGTSEDLAYGSYDSEGRRIYWKDGSWISDGNYRVYVTIGNCQTCFDMAKISDKDVAEVKLNQEREVTGAGRQVFLMKFIPEETGYYSVNMDNTYGGYVKEALTDKRINGQEDSSVDGCWLEEAKTYYIQFSLSSSSATVKVVKGICQWETLSHEEETVCGPVKTVVRCKTHGDTWIKKWDIVEHNSQREDCRILKEATCGADGEMATICSACHQPAERWTIPATGKHKFTAWKTVTAATVWKQGKQERICSVCKKKETKVLPKQKTVIVLNVAGTVPLKTGQSFAVKVTMGKGDRIVSWKSSDPRVVSVKNGKITGLKTGRSATVTVKLKSGKKASFKVKVQKTDIVTKSLKVVNKTTKKAAGKNVVLKKGQTLELSAAVTPVTTSQKVVYTSSVPKIATVSSKGVIKAKQKGKTVIAVKSGKKIYKIQVTVR